MAAGLETSSHGPWKVAIREGRLGGLPADVLDHGIRPSSLVITQAGATALLLIKPMATRPASRSMDLDDNNLSSQPMI